MTPGTVGTHTHMNPPHPHPMVHIMSSSQKDLSGYSRLARFKGAAGPKTRVKSFFFCLPAPRLERVFLQGGLDVMQLDHFLSCCADFSGANNI